VRAFPGGVGDAKCAGNYGPTILPAKAAQERGFTQVLWLTPTVQHGGDAAPAAGSDDASTLMVGEVGTSNIIVLWKRADGTVELVTPPLDDGTILPGVTRDSLLELARRWGEFEVSERQFSIAELCEALRERRVIEMFGSGTAAVVSPVKGIHFDGVDYDVPIDPQIGAGKYAARFLKELMDIQYGRNEDFVGADGNPWSIVI
jgi:branched-chain amino acid aminotransferase